MQRKYVASDIEKCTGCQVCTYICSAVKEKGFNPTLSRIRTLRVGPALSIASACRLCEDPPCITACPTKALSRDEKSGIILVAEDKCKGCGWCVEACDFGAIALHPKKKTVIICDLCGGDPKCISYCPREALYLATSDDKPRIRKKIAKTCVAK